MTPIYTPHNTVPAYQLNWGLTIFWRDSPIQEDTWLHDLRLATEPDGVRILKHRFATGAASQFFVSSKPHVSPSRLIHSVKGRLQHLLRPQKPKAFQRNYCIRSIGESKRCIVEDYVANQLGHHRMVDSRVQQQLARFQKVNSDVDLRKPSFAAHGEYWHNLHVVIVNEARWMEIREDVLCNISDMIERVAAKHEYRLSRVGLLADHIHLTMGCPVDRSPEDVALGYLNNCAYACGMTPMYKFSYYVGTIGEYDRGAVR
jgi:REP element-mobilizing transposase RayT